MKTNELWLHNSESYSGEANVIKLFGAMYANVSVSSWDFGWSYANICVSDAEEKSFITSGPLVIKDAWQVLNKTSFLRRKSVGAVTFRRMTLDRKIFSRMTFSKVTFKKITFSRMTLSRITLTIMTLSRTVQSAEWLKSDILENNIK